MKVELLSYTRDAAELCATAANECYSPIAYTDIHTLSQKKIEGILDTVIDSGHLSTIEHASYTFSIIGISRACSHQLVRHRIASFSQQSQRYVSLDKPDYVIPETIIGAGLEEAYVDVMNNIWGFYDLAMKQGCKAEDARYVLPNACKTNMIMTMNARELLHFFELRMCNKAQWEARDVAKEMYKHCIRVSPKIFQYAGPRCWKDGCIEKEPCKKPLKKYEVENDTKSKEI